jgi:ribosomal protein S18 acetylase RimI-like enzyme
MTSRLPYELRPAIESDRDAIAEIWFAGGSQPGVGPPVMPTFTALRTRVDEEFGAGWNATVAVRDDHVIGFLAIKPSQAVVAELFVRPGLTGSGIGRALLQNAMKAMPSGFTLFTRPANARARRFYEKAGLVFLRGDIHPRFGDPITYYGWDPG